MTCEDFALCVFPEKRASKGGVFIVRDPDVCFRSAGDQGAAGEGSIEARRRDPHLKEGAGGAPKDVSREQTQRLAALCTGSSHLSMAQVMPTIHFRTALLAQQMRHTLATPCTHSTHDRRCLYS